MNNYKTVSKKLKKNNKGSSTRILYLLVLLMYGIQLAIVLFAYNVKSKYDLTIVKQRASANKKIMIISELQNKITNLTGIVNESNPDLELINNQISNLQSKSNESSRLTSMRTIEKNFIYFAWTKFFDIDKAMFITSKGVVIDLDVKPSNAFKYSRSGMFNVSDQELKNALMELNEKVRSQYVNSFVAGNIGKFNNLDIDYLVDGISIAYCKNGVLKLNGE